MTIPSQPIPKLPPPVLFTETDVERAADEWRCSCGPGAIAAILGVTLDEVRHAIPHFEERGYTSPTMMWEALRALGATFSTRVRPSGWPRYGLARIQWEGPWLAPGVPPAAAYRYTHWVGACTLEGEIGIWDINCINNGAGWVALAEWEGVVVPWLLSHAPALKRATGGWFLTHGVEIRR